MRKISKEELIQHFFSKVYPEPNTGCWLWSMTLYDGYGHLKIGGVSFLAHRFSYEIHKGGIPIGLCVLHSCDVRCCVNPDHLFLGTKQDNSTDMCRKGRNRRHIGTLNPNAKLNETDVANIRQSFAHSTIKNIAVKYNVSISLIYQIKKNILWSKSA